MREFSAPKVLAAIGVLTLAMAQVEGLARAQDDYRKLSSVLAARYPQVKNKSRNYLSTDFVRDRSIRREFDASALATSTVPDSVRGLPVQRDIILLQLRPDAKAEQANALLRKYDLNVLSGIGEIGLLIVERGAVPTSSVAAATSVDRSQEGLGALKQTISGLVGEPIVRTAAANTPLGTAWTPNPSTGAGLDFGGKSFKWDWNEGPGTPEASNTDGNWGQKAVRFPAAWNFNETIARGRGTNAVKVGILDVGFAPHEDLNFVAAAFAPMRSHDHGDHVTGIIAAKFNDGIGVDGGCPFAGVTVCTAADLGGGAGVQGMQMILSDVIATLVELILQSPDLKVINLSLGYNWVPNFQRNPNNDKDIQNIVRSHGVIMRSIADLAAERKILLVCAAGNDSGAAFPDIDAQWSSPFNWAARNQGISPTPAQNILVIESVGRSGDRSPFSNVNGHLAAPGEDILSAIAQPRDGYGVESGTSMATPQVTALIAQMYAYNPGLAPDQVVDILKRTATPAPGGRHAPTIDAFAAVLECYNGDRPLRDLADLTGDGQVNMADFEVFRTALLQAEQDPAHNVWPRADLNGSKRLSRNPTDRRSVKGVELSDLEVMMRVWQDKTITADQLPGKL
jgi:subtilisin family serine protease